MPNSSVCPRCRTENSAHKSSTSEYQSDIGNPLTTWTSSIFSTAIGMLDCSSMMATHVSVWCQVKMHASGSRSSRDQDDGGCRAVIRTGRISRGQPLGDRAAPPPSAGRPTRVIPWCSPCVSSPGCRPARHLAPPPLREPGRRGKRGRRPGRLLPAPGLPPGASPQPPASPCGTTCTPTTRLCLTTVTSTGAGCASPPACCAASPGIPGGTRPPTIAVRSLPADWPHPWPARRPPPSGTRTCPWPSWNSVCVPRGYSTTC